MRRATRARTAPAADEPQSLETGGRVSTATLSPKDYAARRKITRQAVMRAITAGRLTSSVTRTDAGHWRIDPAAADREWAAWTDPSKVRKDKAGGRPPRTGSLFPTPEDRADAISHARSSADRIRVDTELKKLELEARRGNLIDRNAVARAAFGMARDLQTSLGSLPDRISARLHGAGSIHEVHRLLTEELANALDALASSKEFREVAGQPDGHENPAT